MKYLVSWTNRVGGSGSDAEADGVRAIQVLSKWSPPEGETFHAFLGRIDGKGGFALVETDSPEALADGPAKFSPWVDFEIIPVADITDTTRWNTEGADFRASVS